MKKKTKIFLITLLVFVFILLLQSFVFASNFASETAFDDNNNESADTAAQNIMGIVTQVIRIVGTGIALIMISVIGIKYMLASGSERAEIKKSATAYIVGAIMLFAGTNILKIIADFATVNVAE